MDYGEIKGAKDKKEKKVKGEKKMHEGVCNMHEWVNNM